MRILLQPELDNVKCFIDDDNIINAIFDGDLTVEADANLSKAIKKGIAILRAENKPTLYLSDVRKLANMAPEVKRSAYKTIMSLDLDRRAYLMEKSGIITLTMNLVMNLFNESKPGLFKLFHREDDARDWLLERKKSS